MRKKFWFKTALALFSIFIVSACSSLIPQTSPDQGDTAATHQALIEQAVRGTATTSGLLTQVARLETQVAASPTAGSLANPATATPVPPTATPTLVPTATTVPPTATPSIPCNEAGFVADVTIPDGSILTPGMNFTKTWRLRNAGACAWTPAYDVVFVSGELLGAPQVVDMPAYVAPGQVIDISLNMVAPAYDGYFRGNWRLRDAAGVLFGLGPKGSSFFVDIQVQTPRVNGPLDFAASYCLAEWTSGAGRLPCPGGSGDSRGYVQRIDKPTLESGYIDDEPVLLTHPQMITDGVIQGKYPAMRVEDGMFFVAVIGCANKAAQCDVSFQLNYQLGSGSIQNLATWREVYDEQFHPVEVNLSGLRGQDVRFILAILSNGSPADDKAQWLAPRVISRGIPNDKEDLRPR